MKKSAFLILLFLSCSVVAQKYYTKTGLTEFKASVEAFEPVEAKNNSTSAVLNIENGDIASLLFVKAFTFRVALMQEHFNENYMESDQFPSATFTGSLLGIEDIDLRKDGSHNVTVKGDIEIHGVKRPMETTAVLEVKNGKLFAKTDFKVKTADHEIKIPKIVVKNIAEVIDVKLSFEFDLLDS